MPSKNRLKIYVENGIYHAYNRGNEKRIIFCDEQDYKVFLYYLKSYLTPLRNFNGTDPLKMSSKIPLRILRLGENFDLYKRIRLLAYCLMPNHFHLMLKQLDKTAMTELMRRVINAYVKYFNERYERIGPLFQGRYKAVLIDKEPYFLHLSRYIHRNPLELLKELKLSRLKDYPYSSYPDYLGKRHTKWIHKEEVMQYFEEAKMDNLKDSFSYKSFVEDSSIDSMGILEDLILEK